MRFSGQTVIVTGASRGIGKAIALKFASEGANVVFTYASNEQAANDTLRELQAFGVKVLALKADSSNADDVQSVIDTAINEFGTIEILVNNAGITKDTLLMRMSEQDWDTVINTNLKGVFLMTKAAIRPMMSAKRGKIINLSSVVALIGNPGQTNYTASKAGVIGFTKSVAREVASRGITANVICPGYIETEMTAKLNEQQREAIMSVVPMKRTGKPEEVAALTAFLASSDADYITGQVISVNGGMTM
jgi:3-oxoacyl-[acyl-carrier protein] reductase